jgi:hypothetical protein
VTASKLIGMIQARRKEIIDGMFEMPAGDFPAYKTLVGRVSGLTEAIDIIRKSSEDEDDE